MGTCWRPGRFWASFRAMARDAVAEGRLFLGCDMVEPEICGVAGGRAAVFSARSPGKTSANQDAAAVLPVGAHECVLAVADGMGGVRGGDKAAHIALETLRARLAESPSSDRLRTVILDAIETANEAVCALGIGAATTLAVVEIQDGTARPYHVGDSLILVVGQRGRIKLETVSHSPVGFALEAGVLDPIEAMHHEDRHLVSNVLGAANMRIEVGSAVRLAQHDTLLLASDGLSDNLHQDEIRECMRKGPLDAAARRLVEEARRRMTQPREGEPSKPDDLTFVGFRRDRE